MKIAFIGLVILHGLIHVLGFVKAFELASVTALASPIPKSLGIFWLLSAFLFLSLAVLYYKDYSSICAIGLISIILSQFLITWFWSDAKFGTIPNVIILMVVLVSCGTRSFNKMTAVETEKILSNITTQTAQLVTKQDILPLPDVVQKWIRTTGIIGKPRIKSAKIGQQALMKMKPEQKNWYAASATQYSTIEPPAFIWTVDLDMMPLMHIKGRDKYVDGKGEMLIKLNSLFNVVNEKGGKMDEGTMQRYLGEMVWLPSLAISPLVQWEAIDDLTAKATMNYKDQQASGIFYFNPEGDFIKFIAQRYMGNEENSKRYPWVLTVDDYAVFEGIKIPSKLKATWKLDEGDWTWLEMEIKEVTYNPS